MKGSVSIVVGAGASFDCAGEPNQYGVQGISVNKDWRPPLTEGLFHAVDTFDTVLSRYRGAAELAPHIRNRLATKSRLEDVLRELDVEEPWECRVQFLHVQLYLQDLFWKISRGYVRNQVGTAYSQLIRDVRLAFGNSLYLTLNYDLFLEHAIESFFNNRFARIDDYVRDPLHLLVKLHGSANWGKRIVNASEQIEVADVVQHLKGGVELQPDIKVLSGDHRPDLIYGREKYFPSLAVPVGSNKLPICPSSHRTIAEDHVRACPTFLFLGISAQDESLLDVLRIAENPSFVVVVAQNEKLAADAFARIESACPSFANATTHFPDHGFYAFMKANGINQILAKES